MLKDDNPDVYGSFLVCNVEEDITTENYIYVVLLSISFICIILTLLVYLILKDLRNSLFGNLVVAFLINVGTNYLCNIITRARQLAMAESDFQSSPFCTVLGYITHNTFISFFLWMNVMALNLTYTFSNVLKRGSNNTVQLSKKPFLLFLLYAQFLPIIISLVIAAIDSYGSCDLTLPNMGRYSCFVGSPPWNEAGWVFTETSQFLYFYLFVLIILLVNVVCCIITGISLTIHWQSVRNMRTR